MKKFLAVLLTVTMLLGAMAAVVSAGEVLLYQGFQNDDTFTLGDLNGDGSVNAQDAYFMKATLVGAETGIEVVLDAADFDADAKCSATDSYSLKLCLAGAKTTESFENGKQIYKLTIGGISIEEFCIVLPADSTEEDNTYFAYLNFMKYVRNATGYEIPLCWGTPSTEHAVYFNYIDLNSEDGQYLGIDGYRMDVTDGNLNIYGTYRGNGYAVFDILEEYLGFRFYRGNETFLYKSRTVDIPEGTSVEKIPEINFRHARQSFGQYNSSNNEEKEDMPNGMNCHYFANKLNASEGGYSSYEKFYGTKLGPLYSNAHSFLEYWQMGTGSWPDASIPEGMSEYMYSSDLYQAKFDSGFEQDPYGWQPCATSNDDFNTLFEGMIDCNRMVMSWGRPTFIEEGQTLFSFSIADNQMYCTCRNCTKISRNEGFSGLYLQLYNRATEEAQAYYPGVRLYGIVYAKDFPATIKPHKNFVILYCGIGCNNHMIGKEECYASGGQLEVQGFNNKKVRSSNAQDEVALPFWGNLCKETGAELWFWIYPVTYHYYLTGCPNVFNFYWDMKWLHEEANVTGFFYEGGGREYNFETLKEYIAVQYMWDMDMTYDEFKGHIKEFLYMTYGDGYEELYRYIELQTEAGDQCGTCFINNFDRPGDMYSYDFLAEHYDEMRELLVTAYGKAKNDTQRGRIETLLVCCDFMGLTSVHNEWYLNGTRVEDYKERYDWMYNYIKDHNMEVFSSNLYKLPSSIVYSENPMKQIYEQGSRRPGVDPY
ncbi:MAG: DUF4838 domain-containing protein [Clostridia bacterium]|nr:DUF4838 domain-containing protein [Clostridia bacterium]